MIQKIISKLFFGLTMSESKDTHRMPETDVEIQLQVAVEEAILDGKSAASIAAEAGTTGQHVRRWLRGEVGLGFHTAARLAEALRRPMRLAADRRKKARSRESTGGDGTR